MNRQSHNNWLHHPQPTWIQLSILLLIGLAAYANSLTGPFLFDDSVVITGEPMITRFAVPLSDPRLVTDFSFALNYLVHGASTFGFHLVNLLLHLTTALLVYAFVRLLFTSPKLSPTPLAERARSIAFLAAALFVAHPIQTQAVTYIAQRYAVMATLFYLAACCLYLRSRTSGGSKPHQALFYAGFLLCTILAFLSKQNAATLPATIVIIELLLFSAPLQKRMLIFAPFILAVLAGATYLATTDVSLPAILAKLRVDTMMSRQDYLLTQLRVMATYLRLLILPIDQNLDYDYPIYTSFSNPAVLWSSLLHLAILATAWFCIATANSKGRHRLLLALGIFWFYITLVVESSIIPIVDVIYEHRLYLPSVGFCLVASVLLYLLPIRHQREIVRVTIAVALILTLGSATVIRNGVWQSGMALWSDTAAKSPHKARPLNNLGIQYFNIGNYEKALDYYLKAIATDPRYMKAYFNAGETYQKLGRYQEALGYYQYFVAFWPDYPDSYKNLAEVCTKLGNASQAAFYDSIYEKMKSRILQARYR